MVDVIYRIIEDGILEMTGVDHGKPVTMNFRVYHPSQIHGCNHAKAHYLVCTAGLPPNYAGPFPMSHIVPVLACPDCARYVAEVDFE